MPASEVVIDLCFATTEDGRTSYHSFANLINVVHAELQLLERMSRPGGGLRTVIRLCEIASRAFRQASIATQHCEPLTEFRSRVQVELDRLDIQPRYERDAAEACDIIAQVLDDADLRVQEALARHAVVRPLVRYGRQDAESLLAALAPSVEISVAGDPLLPHGLTEAAGRLAAAFTAHGPARLELSVLADDAVANGVREKAPPAQPSAATVLDIRAAGGLDPALVPSGPPPSCKASGIDAPVPALLALMYYLTTPRGRLTVDPAGPLVRVTVARG